MSKEITKDYSIDAFRFYAEQGRPTDAEIKNMSIKSEAERKDLFAVQKVYKALDNISRKIVDIIYFENSVNELSSKNIKLLISNTCVKTSIDEKKIKLILKEARIQFAIERGMRICK